MTDEQKQCAHKPDGVLFVCRKCRLSERASLIGDRPEMAWLGLLDSVRFTPPPGAMRSEELAPASPSHPSREQKGFAQ